MPLIFPFVPLNLMLISSHSGKQAVRDKLDEIIAMEKQKKLSVKDKSFQVILELAWEMYLRGFFVEKVDLYKSSASKFILHEKSLLPPFTALTGISTTAANNIVQARKDGEFTSIDDLKKRASLTTTIIESLRETRLSQWTSGK